MALTAMSFRSADDDSFDPRHQLEPSTSRGAAPFIEPPPAAESSDERFLRRQDLLDPAVFFFALTVSSRCSRTFPFLLSCRKLSCSSRSEAPVDVAVARGHVFDPRLLQHLRK